ncbi:MAG: hypothetical protein H7330_11140, partial [Hymenobacteraceae bacterium]|nr:hypothetical protein [Hymenobacteraceae bacterium]
MNTFSNWFSRSALAAIFCVSGLTAAAQSVLPHPNVASCGTNRSIPATNPGGVFPLASSAGLFYFDPGTSGITAVTWSTRGDLALDGAPTTYLGNPAINVKAVNLPGTTQPGYGKGQLIATYVVPGCSLTVVNQSVVFDVFKTFAAPNNIVGPTCVTAGQTYAWVLPPVISSFDQVNQRIGLDSYFWTSALVAPIIAVTIAPAAPPRLTTGVSAYSGDFSVIRMTMPNNVGKFRLTAQVGTCNSAATGKFIDVSVQPAKPIISTTGVVTCRDTDLNTSASNITATVTNPSLGATYTWTIPPGWSISSNTGTSVQITTNNSAGSFSVTAGGAGCGSVSSDPFPVTRNLTAANNYNTIVASPLPGAPSNCYLRSIEYTFSIQNAPAGSTFVWTYPTGWIPTNNATLTGSSIRLTPNNTAANGSVSVKTTGCTGLISLPVVRSGPIATCSFNVSQAGCQAYLVAIAPAPNNNCPTSGTRYMQWRLYDLGSATPTVHVETYTPTVAQQTFTTAQFTWATVIASGNARVEVDVVNNTASGSCLAETYAYVGNYDICLGRPAPGAHPGPASGQAAPATELRAWPNPSTGTV